jgi:hypothetical protein
MSLMDFLTLIQLASKNNYNSICVCAFEFMTKLLDHDLQLDINIKNKVQDP